MSAKRRGSERRRLRVRRWKGRTPVVIQKKSPRPKKKKRLGTKGDSDLLKKKDLVSEIWRAEKKTKKEGVDPQTGKGAQPFYWRRGEKGSGKKKGSRRLWKKERCSKKLRLIREVQKNGHCATKKTGAPKGETPKMYKNKPAKRGRFPGRVNTCTKSLPGKRFPVTAERTRQKKKRGEYKNILKGGKRYWKQKKEGVLIHTQKKKITKGEEKGRLTWFQ